MKFCVDFGDEIAIVGVRNGIRLKKIAEDVELMG
jgi:hypothetical protein